MRTNSNCDHSELAESDFDLIVANFSTTLRRHG
jgi:hypothetical protein